MVVACGAPDPDKSEETRAVQGADQPLTREAIERAVFERAPAPPPAEGVEAEPAEPDPAVVRAQILLDRAHFSPGVIDGLGGDNTRQAIAAYEEAQKLPVDGVLDAEVFKRLTAGSREPVLMDYAITEADLAGPFIGKVPDDLEALAALKTAGYATPLEALAERFHMTEALLFMLNPGADFTNAGERIVVSAVSSDALAADVARSVIDKDERSLRAYGADDALLAFYPATIGSSERPAPSGSTEVRVVAPRPNYTYDPDRVSYDRGDQKLVVPPGPNNPVGAVWIDLERDTYGIHGTPDPSKVGKTFSNGCVRLTNWDALELSKRVKPGVRVEFT